MPKSLKPRQVQPPGKHARFQETTIAFQLKENKRFVKESSIPWMPPSPTSLPASPKRYVHGLVDPVFTLLFCGNSTVSVLVNRMGWACLSDYRGKWHSAAYNWIFVFFFLTQTKVASFTQCGEKKLPYVFPGSYLNIIWKSQAKTALGKALTVYIACSRMDIHLPCWCSG